MSIVAENNISLAEIVNLLGALPRDSQYPYIMKQHILLLP